MVRVAHVTERRVIEQTSGRGLRPPAGLAPAQPTLPPAGAAGLRLKPLTHLSVNGQGRSCYGTANDRATQRPRPPAARWVSAGTADAAYCGGSPSGGRLKPLTHLSVNGQQR